MYKKMITQFLFFLNITIDTTTDIYNNLFAILANILDMIKVLVKSVRLLALNTTLI